MEYDDRPHDEPPGDPHAPAAPAGTDEVLALLEQRLPVREEARRRLRAQRD